MPGRVKVNAAASDSTEVSVTISIGVAEAGDAQRSVAEVMKAADKALYKAKIKGRNQVCLNMAPGNG
jgi:diguanylate cyclase (GGDEF)-like protein